MTNPEGKGESSATKNPVIAHCDGPNNETIQPWTQDDAMENNGKEHVKLKLNILHYVVTVETDREIRSTNFI